MAFSDVLDLVEAVFNHKHWIEYTAKRNMFTVICESTDSMLCKNAIQIVA